MAKRRTPPLFEVLSAPDRRPGPSGGVLGRPPVQVQVPRPQPAADTFPGDKAAVGPRGIRITTSGIFLTIAIIVGLVFAVWFFAFHLGQDHKQKELEPYLGATPKDSGPSSPLNPQGGVPNPLPQGAQPDPTPSPTPPANPLADPRKPGNNYLHIVILPWKDAEKAVAYLTNHGIPAAAVPSKPVDPGEARAKNLNHLVFALEPIPSDQYKTSEHRRQELIDKVRGIGNKWQHEEKGPSDFGAPGWAKFVK